MSGKRTRRLLKGAAVAAALLLVLLGLYVSVFAFPYPLFPYKAASKNLALYSDRPLGPGITDVLVEAQDRIEAMEHYREEERHRIFLCRSQRLYAFYARLLAKPVRTQGVNVSLLGNTFLSEPVIRRIRDAGPGVARHSRFEGRIAFTIGHEVAHEHIGERLGFRATRRLPAWKAEGWADYQANLAMIRRDPNYSLPERVLVVLTDDFWGAEGEPAREFFRWQVMAEYLGEVRRTGLEELADDGVTERQTWEDLLRWQMENGKAVLTLNAASGPD